MFRASLEVIRMPRVAPRAHLGIQGAAWESLGAADGTFGAPRAAQGDLSEATTLIDGEASETMMGGLGPSTSI